MTGAPSSPSDGLIDSLISPDGTRINRRIVADPAIYEAELDRVFRRCWQFVGHESQVPEAGSFVTSYIGPQSVVLSRDRHGELRVLLNTCSHRAARVCRVDCGRADRFTCSNHGWTYGVDGALLSAPHESDGYAGVLDKAALGLAPLAQVESYHGLVFATFDPDAPSLADYLGDATYYLDTVFGRWSGGSELLGGVHRWTVKCNWKLPPENQAPDLYHAESAHASIYEATGADSRSFTSDLTQVITDSGHTLCFRELPTALPTVDELADAADNEADRQVIRDYMTSADAAAREILGSERSAIETIAGTVFPNFSFISNVFNIRMSVPRSHDEIEMRSWCIVPAAAPPAVKASMRRVYSMTFGPAGMVESDDCENWVSMTTACSSPLSHDVPFYLGLGLGQEFTHENYPGQLSPAWSEHSMRGYWQTWRRWMGS